MSTECKCQDMVEIDALAAADLAHQAAAGLNHQVALDEPRIVEEWISKVNARNTEYNEFWFYRLLRRKRPIVKNREELEVFLAKRNEEQIRENRNMIWPPSTQLEKYEDSFERLTESRNLAFSIKRAAQVPGAKNLYLSIDTIKFLRRWAAVAPPQP